MERLRQRRFLAAASGIKATASAFVLQTRKRVDDDQRGCFTVEEGRTRSNGIGFAAACGIVRAPVGPVRTGHDYVYWPRAASWFHSRGCRRLRGACSESMRAQRQNGIRMTDSKTPFSPSRSRPVLIAWQSSRHCAGKRGRELQRSSLRKSSRYRPSATPSPASRRNPRQPDRRRCRCNGAGSRCHGRQPRRRVAASPRVQSQPTACKLDRPQGRRIDDLGWSVSRDGRSKSPHRAAVASGSPIRSMRIRLTNAAGANVKVLSRTRVTQSGSGALSVGRPVR